MSDDTPTERLPEPVPEAGAESAVAAKPASGGMSRGLLITLIVIGSLLLVAIVALLIALLAGRGDDNSTAGPTPTESSASPTPSPSETEDSPSPSPSESESEDPAPPSNDPKIDSFKVSTKLVVCPAPDAPGAQPPPDLHFTWQTSRTDNVVFGINAPGDDATNGSFAENLPEDGSLDRPVSCSDTVEKTRYTLTVVGEGGKKVSQTIEVTVRP